MEFHKTKLGNKFYEIDFPRAVSALEKIAKALTTSSDLQVEEKSTKKMEKVKENKSIRLKKEDTYQKKNIKQKLLVERLMQFKEKDGSEIFSRDFLNNLVNGLD